MLERSIRNCISNCAQLESRRLLSAVIEDGTLVVTGTSAADTIKIELIPGTGVLATVNDEINTFSSGNVDQMRIDGLAGDDNISVDYGTKTLEANGGEGNDTISSGASRSTMYGGAGNDLLIGGSRQNHFYPDRDLTISWPLSSIGDDTMFGYGHDDSFYIDQGSDNVDGGGAENNNFIYYNSRDVDISVSIDGIANDGAAGETGNVVNVSFIVTGGGNDRIVGSNLSDAIMTDTGNDTVFGRGGDDSIKTGDYPAYDFHGDDDDQAYGGSGNDTINDFDGRNRLYGEGGEDTFEFWGYSTVHGGSGNDTIHGAGRLGRYFGEGGNDLITIEYDPSLNGNYERTIDGGSGHDTIRPGGRGLDISLDQTANDGEIGENDQDNYRFIEEIISGHSHFGGSAADSDRFNASAAGYAVTLRGFDGNDTLIGGSSADLLLGGDGDDSITGNGGNDKLRGEAGSDFLIGNAGKDSFNGGKGIDTLIAADGIAELVIGGESLSDEADVDDGLDEVVRVEILI